MDECRILPDACQGHTFCVNQEGGYLCRPRGLLSPQYRPETSYPEVPGGFSDTFLPARPRSVEQSYPRVRTTAQCILGYAPAEDGTCNGESADTPSDLCMYSDPLLQHGLFVLSNVLLL